MFVEKEHATWGCNLEKGKRQRETPCVAIVDNEIVLSDGRSRIHPMKVGTSCVDSLHWSWSPLLYCCSSRDVFSQPTVDRKAANHAMLACAMTSTTLDKSRHCLVHTACNYFNFNLQIMNFLMYDTTVQSSTGVCISLASSLGRGGVRVAHHIPPLVQQPLQLKSAG